MRKIFFGMFLTIIGCSNAGTDKKTESRNTSEDTMKNVSESLLNAVTQDKKDTAKSIMYEYKNDTLLQTLRIKYNSTQEIQFELTSLNRIKNQTSTLTGTAKSKLNQDPETDEDDEGNAYAAIEYHYTKDGCSLSVRIDMDTKDKAKVFEYNCDKLHKSNCPFASIGVLKKI